MRRLESSHSFGELVGWEPRPRPSLCLVAKRRGPSPSNSHRWSGSHVCYDHLGSDLKQSRINNNENLKGQLITGKKSSEFLLVSIWLEEPTAICSASSFYNMSQSFNGFGTLLGMKTPTPDPDQCTMNDSFPSATSSNLQIYAIVATRCSRAEHQNFGPLTPRVADLNYQSLPGANPAVSRQSAAGLWRGFWPIDKDML